MTLSPALFSETFQNPTGALLWQLESGVDMPLSDEPVKININLIPTPPSVSDIDTESSLPQKDLPRSSLTNTPPSALVATPEARIEAVRLATTAQTLDDLRTTIQNFDGIQIKRHATHLVFADGNPSARVMIIGDAPGTEDDQNGQPFLGEDGALLDKMFAAIGLSRKNNNPIDSLYITTILNWRPPGNRTPTPAEFEISLPFIERHIALIRPDILVCVGGEAAKLLLGTTDGITKLRGKWRNYRPLSLAADVGFSTRALSIYHPSFLRRTPAKKRDAWEDLQMIQSAIKESSA